jgi:hypothetical protein
MGEVWANILHNVYIALGTAYEWSLLFDEDLTELAGNTIFFHLLFDTLLLQPCNPTCKPSCSAMFSQVDTVEIMDGVWGVSVD